MAVDAQGGEKARPYVEGAGASFTTIVDEENLLGQLYSFRAIPNGLLVDEEGVLRYAKFGGFDIRKPDVAEIVESWAVAPSLEELASKVELSSVSPQHQESLACFRQGMKEYRKGNLKEAVALWRRGTELEPDNFIVRKQMWAVEHPEKFYAGKVDFAWQREQMEKGT